MKIYTRTGDAGETSLFTGDRLPKTSAHFEALGAVDELNSCIGLAVAHLPQRGELTEELEIIQHHLFDLGAVMATPRETATARQLQKTPFPDHLDRELENWIDALEEKLPKLSTFILPGGDPAGATLHLARTLCRRAERRALVLDIPQPCIRYLNRLSDYLFTAARYANHDAGCFETAWRQQ